jgi:hypothetical protein
MMILLYAGQKQGHDLGEMRSYCYIVVGPPFYSKSQELRIWMIESRQTHRRRFDAMYVSLGLATLELHSSPCYYFRLL